MFTEFDGYVPAAGPVLDPAGQHARHVGHDARARGRVPVPLLPAAGPWCAPPRRAVGGRGRVARPAHERRRTARPLRALSCARCATKRRAPDATRDRTGCATGAGSVSTRSRRDAAAVTTRCRQRESRSSSTTSRRSWSAECEGRHGRDPVGLRGAVRLRARRVERRAARVRGAAGARPRRQTDARSCTGGSIASTVLKPGEYEVVDYKTGGFWADDWTGHVRRRHAAAARDLRSRGRPLLKSIDPKAARRAGHLHLSGGEGASPAQGDSRAVQGPDDRRCCAT